MSKLSIASPEAFLESIRSDAFPNGKLSVRGVAKCCGCDHTAIIRASEFGSLKLAETMGEYGFEAGELARNGFPPQAVSLVIDHFAFESRLDFPIAKQVARALMAVGIATIISKLVETVPTYHSAIPEKHAKLIELDYELERLRERSEDKLLRGSGQNQTID